MADRVTTITSLILKILWNGLTIALLVLALWWAYTTLTNTPEPTKQLDAGQPVLEAIQRVNKHVFIEHYSMVDVQYSEVPEGWLEFLGRLGVKQEFVVLLRGRVPAGFDLQELTEEDIWTSSDGKRVQLTLPPPVIFEENVAVDFENSRVVAQSDMCPGFICQESSLDAYQEEALPHGKDLLIDFARRSGILEQSAKNGKIYYEQFLRSLGFEEVRVVVTGYST
jgi:hypothetical protein